MKIFISWSGEISGKVARILRDWLPHVIQSIQPFVSSKDIKKGARWYPQLLKELDESYFGILCVTKENINSPWLNFEAGALGKSFELDPYVCPFLFGINIDDVNKGPLGQFQMVLFNHDSIKELIFNLNEVSGKERIERSLLSDNFEVWWPKLEDQLKDIYKLIMKKIVWAFETEDLDASSEIELMVKEGLEVAAKWYPGQDTPSDIEKCDLLVYVFGKSEDSTDKLKKVINCLIHAGKVIPLIVYTGRAGGDGRLNEEEFSLVKKLDKYIIANMPETLKTALRNLGRD